MEVKLETNDLLNNIGMDPKRISSDFSIYDYAEEDFDNVIMERGLDYYIGGKVLSVTKDPSNSIFRATVQGAYDKTYDVWVEYNLDDDCTYVDYGCTCPCDFPCKHEYAVLLAIRDGKYDELNFKKQVYKKIYNLYDVLKDIPADRIKEFLLSKEGKEAITIDNELFEKKFIKYIPVQSYEYYYNNLYNDILINNMGREKLDTYLNLVVDYFSSQMYEEVFKIMKAIIEAYHDTDNLYSQMFIVDLFPKLSMYMRVVSKNCNRELKEELLVWSGLMKQVNYYDNIFLHDVVDGIN